MSKQQEFSPYPVSELPLGFKYPNSYLELARDLGILKSISKFPWWFSNAEGSLKKNMNIYFNLTGNQYLIEFARDGDWAACFDASDHSGDPKVVVYDLGNKNNHYEKENFDEWLKFVINEIENYY